MPPAVEIDNLVKRYGQLTAVNGISFEIRPGEIFALLGPNGAGKSTTISILCCLLPPTSGRVAINGMDISTHSRKIKTLIGLVTQEISLYPTLTAMENLYLFGRLHGMREGDLRRRSVELLDLVGLMERAHTRVCAYSGGMKRRINIAAGLIHRPQILFLDEPTAGVDPQSRHNIYEALKVLNRDEGLTVLMTTHIIEEAQRMADRVAIMDLGRIVALDTVPELIGLLEGHSCIRITARDISECAPRALTELLPPSSRVDPIQEGLAVEVKNVSSVLPVLIQNLVELGIHIESIEVKESNLEAVFIHLTGKELRD